LVVPIVSSTIILSRVSVMSDVCDRNLCQKTLTDFRGVS